MRTHTIAPTISLVLTLLLLTIIALGLPMASAQQDPLRPPQSHHLIQTAEASQSQSKSQQQRDDHDDIASPPEYRPIATPGPDQDAALASKDYYQTTYYACRTADGDGGGDSDRGDDECGWHVPLVKAEAPRRLSMGWVVAAVLVVAGVFTVGLL